MATLKPGQGYHIREMRSMIPGWKYGIYRIGESGVISMHATKREAEAALRKLRRQEREGHSKGIREGRKLFELLGLPKVPKPPTAAERQRSETARKREEHLADLRNKSVTAPTRKGRARAMERLLRAGGKAPISQAQRHEGSRGLKHSERRKLPPD